MIGGLIMRMKCTSRNEFGIALVAASAMTVVTAVPARASATSFRDDTYVTATAGVTRTSWINDNAFKPNTPSAPGGEFRMASASNRACFLSHIGGDFNGMERAYVYYDRGYWAVGAAATSGSGATAGASCVSIPNTSYVSPAPDAPAYSWRQEYYPIVILLPTPATDYEWNCFLTSVTGSFQGSGERVQVWRRDASAWIIGGSSAQHGVTAEARCVMTKTSFNSGPFSVSQYGPTEQTMKTAGGWNATAYRNDTRATYPDLNNTCFLQRMTGSFQGSGEWIGVAMDGVSHLNNTYNQWWLMLNSYQSGVATTATCVR
jgi:hypothetical protein